MNNWKLINSFILALRLDFRHGILHRIIPSMINIENISVLLDHSILFVEIWLFRTSVSHVIMVFRFRVNLFKVFFSSAHVFTDVGFRGALAQRCRTVDMILHFLMVGKLLLHYHTFMCFYLRGRI
jgi:hypothetical protein